MSYDAACYCGELAEGQYDSTLCIFCEEYARHRLQTLGRNLAIAGALWQAFWDGYLDGGQ